MPKAKEAIEAYAAAWNTSDPQATRRLVEQALIEDAVMAYPSFEAHGWEGISGLMTAYKMQSPGFRIELTSDVEVPHGWL